MRYWKWIGMLAALTLLAACFFPWVRIESKDIIVTGFEASGTHYGNRGYAHAFFLLCFLLLSLIPRIWAKRLNIFFAALNIAWTISHFMVFRCEGGECPQRQSAFWVVAVCSVLVLIASLNPDIGRRYSSGQEPETGS